MGQIFFFLLIAGAVVSWIFAGIRGHSFGGSKGVTLFIINLISAIAAVSLLWVVIVYPSLGCHGFLCGLQEMISWILLSAIMMIIWPLILMATFKKKWPNQVRSSRQSDELLDDEL